MFENTLLILKTDYLHKRKQVLLKVLAEGFQIQGSRKLIFSPELAAEFYNEYAEEDDFMLNVILLSKGPVEAFILTKDDAVRDLLRIMICYFTTAPEMERFMHITRSPRNVAREINFIFPNYIHEPTEFFDQAQFCNRPMLKPLISEIYDVMQNVSCQDADWKTKIAEYLVHSNTKEPQISNQNMIKPDINVQTRAQQTVFSYDVSAPGAAATKAAAMSRKPYKSSSPSSSPLSTTSPHSSVLLTSSSCITCSGFERSEPGIPEIDLSKRLQPAADEKICVDEEIVWKEIIVYEEVIPEEESEEEKEAKLIDFIGEGGAVEGAEDGESIDVTMKLDKLPSEVELHSEPIVEDIEAEAPAAEEALEAAPAAEPIVEPVVVEATPPPPPPVAVPEPEPEPEPEPVVEPEPEAPAEEAEPIVEPEESPVEEVAAPEVVEDAPVQEEAAEED